MKLTLPIYILAAAIFALALGLFFTQSDVAKGIGYIGWPVHMQSADGELAVGTTAVTVFTDATDCKARVITTNNGAIWLSFDEDYLASSTLANGIGHYQAASTTVAYESGIYGCGWTTAYSAAAGTITISSY